MGDAVAVAEAREPVAGSPLRSPRGASVWPSAAVVFAAALLSLPRLGSRTLWLDEAYTVGATNQLFDTWRNTAGTQAAYYLLIWPSTRLSTDPVWLRLPSAVLGLAALVIVMRVGRRIGGQRVALLAGGGMALSWSFARYSVEARSYTLALLIVSTSWLALVAAVQADDDDAHRRWWWLFYGATMLAPLAHGLAALNLFAQLGALAIAPDGRRGIRRAAVMVPVLAVEVGALFALGANDVGAWVGPLSWGQLQSANRLLLGYGLTGAVLTALVAVAVVIAVRRYLRERSAEAWIQLLPVFWALGPPIIVLMMSLVRPYLEARYLFPSLPGFFLLIAGLLVRSGSTARVALASAVVAGLLLVDQRFVTTTGLEDWSGLTACIAANSIEGDRVLTAAAHRSALDYYWSERPGLSAVSPLDPVDPLGQVRRIYDSRLEGAPFRSVLLEDTSGSVWFVDRTDVGYAVIAGMAFDEELREHFDVQKVWHFEGMLSLTRLDPVGSERPRGSAPCDTVEPPDG